MRKMVLLVLAVLCAAAAVIVLLFVPRNGGDSTADDGQNSGYVERNEDGSALIRAEELSTETVSFYRLSEDSAVELIAIRGEDGAAYAALGTCQSCNGSPNAWYSQDGPLLRCNNCGLTFPLSVIGVDGAGCHPIMIDPSAVTRSGDNLVIGAAVLRGYEPLFEGIAAH